MIDKETGGIIPIDGRGKKRKETAKKNGDREEALICAYQKQLNEKDAVIQQLTAENQQLKKDLSALFCGRHKR